MIEEFGVVGEFGMFAPNIVKIISDYRDKFSDNMLNTLNGDKSLSPTDFIDNYGCAPWDLINEIFDAFHLPYTIQPPRYSVSPGAYIIKLQRKDSGMVIEPSSLSSGEKVLLRFSLAILSYDPIRVKLRVPAVLLLDEVDAALHPCMLHHWMQTIREEFVGKRKVNCIIATHSPITVALAPEDGIFELIEGIPVPRRIDKQQALNRLTVGLPTLSVDYSGQRQVFVESDTDAEIFTTIATTVKSGLALQRTLAFVSTGYRNKYGVEENSGCDVVMKITRTLRENGNTKVFGLVDWDGKRKSDGFIKVLAEDSHYTLENILLDPLLIGALLLRNSSGNFPDNFRFTSLVSRDPKIYQAIADHVQNQIIYPPDAPIGIQRVSYLDAPCISVKRAFTQTPGHTIELLLEDAFPYLRQFVKNRGALVKKIVSHVLPEYPGLCPMVVAEAFRTIAAEES